MGFKSTCSKTSDRQRFHHPQRKLSVTSVISVSEIASCRNCPRNRSQRYCFRRHPFRPSARLRTVPAPSTSKIICQAVAITSRFSQTKKDCRVPFAALVNQSRARISVNTEADRIIRPLSGKNDCSSVSIGQMLHRRNAFIQ